MIKYFKDGLTNIELNDDEVVLTLKGKKFIAKQRALHLTAIGSGIGEIPLVVNQLKDTGYTHYIEVKSEDGEFGYISLYSRDAEKICELTGRKFRKGYGNSKTLKDKKSLERMKKRSQLRFAKDEKPHRKVGKSLSWIYKYIDYKNEYAPESLFED
ncbi:hypothetical protein AALH12_07005 [Streptococcus ferus]|uniref:hypothetical protein n=1 Tax=Streptococcus ferus TaxID=1345 RepID=UPI0035113BE3